MPVVITASPIRVEAVNQAAGVVPVKGAVLSEVAPKAVDLARAKAVKVVVVGRAGRTDRVAKAKIAVKAAKFTMASQHL